MSEGAGEVENSSLLSGLLIGGEPWMAARWEDGDWVRGLLLCWRCELVVAGGEEGKARTSQIVAFVVEVCLSFGFEESQN